MSKAAAILKLEEKHLKKDIPEFHVGDTIKIHTRIIEGNKERIQIFMGTVIARSGYGLSETVSIHRVAYGEGMERVFPINSPRIAKIEVVKTGKVRRAKLYHLRGTSGKKARVKGSVRARRQVVGVEAEVDKEEQQDNPQEEIKEEAVVAANTQAETEKVIPENTPSQPVTGESTEAEPKA